MDISEDVKATSVDGFLNYLLRTSMSPKLHTPCFGGVLSVRTDDTVPCVMRRLSVEGFSSAPVVSDGIYYGFIEMLDLVKFVTSMFWSDDPAAWQNFWDNETRFRYATVLDVMAYRRKTPHRVPIQPEAVYPNNSVMHALELMATRGHHRVPILASDSRLLGIFTQSMMISELQQRLHLLSPLLRSRPIHEVLPALGKGAMVGKDVQSAREDDRAINAFIAMATQGVTGLPIVDEYGTLAGALSVTDLKAVGFNGQYFARLFEPIKRYKQLMQEDFPLACPRTHYSRKVLPRTALFVTENHTFEDVIRLMDDGNIHRVFVCDAASVSQGRHTVSAVITQTDILNVLWKHYTYVL